MLKMRPRRLRQLSTNRLGHHSRDLLRRHIRQRQQIQQLRQCGFASHILAENDTCAAEDRCGSVDGTDGAAEALSDIDDDLAALDGGGEDVVEGGVSAAGSVSRAKGFEDES